MRALGNVLWHFPFFGFLNAAVTYLVGLLLIVTVIAAPVGLGLLQYAKFLLAPYSREMIRRSEMDKGQESEVNPLWKTYSTIVSIVYFPFGLILAVLAAVQVFFLAITIIGIPVAIVIAKSLGTYLMPVNKICISKAVADEMERRQAQSVLDERAQTRAAKGDPAVESKPNEAPLESGDTPRIADETDPDKPSAA